MSTFSLIDGSQVAGTLNGLLADFFRNYGPISYGGALWMFPLTTDDSTGTADLNAKIYKSVDNGATWVRQDQAHAPALLAPSAPYWDGSSSTVTILAISHSPTVSAALTEVCLVDFDMSTGLFGTPYAVADWFVSPSGANGTGPQAWVLHPSVFKLASGTLRVVYTYWYWDVGSPTHFGSTVYLAQVYFRDFAGTSWSPPTLLPADNTGTWGAQTDLQACVQDGDVLHVVLGDKDLSGNYAVSNGADSNYVQIAADGSFSSPIDLHTLIEGVFSNSLLFSNCNTLVISGNNVLIPCWVDNGGTNSIGVLIGTPKSAPSFTYVNIATGPTPLDGFALAPQDLKIAHIGSTDIVAWVGLSSTTFNQSLAYQSTSSDQGATWSSPTQIFNLDTTPPSPVTGQDTLDIFSLSLGALPGGSLGVAFTTWAAYYVAFTPAPLAISCGSPPSAQVGVAYSHTIPATGGTEPYSFDITAGQLPPGLSLDPASGIVSGTPPDGANSFNILHLDPTTHNDEGAAIDSFWESGLLRAVNDFASRMIRVAALDIWIRGNGTLITTVFGPDKVQSLTPQLLTASGVPSTLSPDPGMMYQEKFDLAHVENYTVRLETNAIDAWFELSELVGYAKQDLFNR
jgi:hypothetical protein